MANVKISTQYLKDLTFEIFGAPELFLTSITKPDIEVGVDIEVKKLNDEAYEVALKIKADASSNHKKLFNCEVIYAGIFIIKNIKQDSLEEVLLVYCPNLLFPFIRRIIAGVVADGGFSPLMLDPIDFSAIYKKRMQAN